MWIRSIINFLRKSFFYKRLSCFYSLDENLITIEKKATKIAGIVGWINKNNKVDLLIDKALSDGMNKIIIYSCIEDPKFYYDNVEPLIKRLPDKIFYAGCVKNKQFLYDTISDVYVSANSPAYKEIKEESRLTNTSFHEI
jgi:hypothetical protein